MKPQKIKTLIVGAWAKELAPWVDLDRRYQHIDGDTAYLAAGIGPVAATFGLTHFLEDYRPEQIFAVGTAGYTPISGFREQDVVRVETVTMRGRPECYLPDLVNQDLALPPPDSQALSDLPGTKAFCPQDISKGDNWGNLLGHQGIGVEHLESYAYAFVAQKFRIPISIVLGITNKIGSNAHEQWLENEAIVMQKVKNVLEKV